MSVVFKCNRCATIYEKNTVKQNYMMLPNSKGEFDGFRTMDLREHQIHLCDPCRIAFDAFMKKARLSAEEFICESLYELQKEVTRNSQML